VVYCEKRGGFEVKNDSSLLKVNDLKAYFYLDEGVLKAVDGVSFKVRKEKVLGLVGESGCGKSVTAQSILRIVPDPGKIEGKILLQRKNGNAKKGPLDLAGLDSRGKEIRSIRGKEIAMIFQEPMTSLSHTSRKLMGIFINSLLRIGNTYLIKHIYG